MSDAADRRIAELEDEVRRLRDELQRYRTTAVPMKRAQLDALPEYSCSLPTGQVIGKRWKRNAHAFGRGPACEPQWWLGEYTPSPDPALIGIDWRRIAISDEHTEGGE